VVVDIFRASSTMIAALAHGVTEIRTFAQLEECRAMKAQGYLIAGERDGLTADGFEMGNSPVAYISGQYAGRKLAMTTTNGTQAIHHSAGALEILIGAFPNLNATARYIQTQEKDVLIHCAGWKGRFNLEDSLYAGALVEALANTHLAEEDGALAMRTLYSKEKDNLSKFLSQASHAKRLQNHQIEADIDFCLSLDLYDLIVKLQNGVLIGIPFASLEN
jgi:2-phosphosulfolactate phosphatase